MREEGVLHLECDRCHAKATVDLPSQASPYPTVSSAEGWSHLRWISTQAVNVRDYCPSCTSSIVEKRKDE